MRQLSGKTPNPRPQAPELFQTSTSKSSAKPGYQHQTGFFDAGRFLNAVFRSGVWRFSGVWCSEPEVFLIPWCLRFGAFPNSLELVGWIWCFSRSLEIGISLNGINPANDRPETVLRDQSNEFCEYEQQSRITARGRGDRGRLSEDAAANLDGAS